MVANEVAARCSRHLYTTPMASIGATDAVNFRLLRPVKPPVGCRCSDPLFCIRTDPGAYQSPLERAKRRLPCCRLIGAYQPFYSLIGLRCRFPVRLTPVNGAQRLLHPARADGKPRLLRGRYDLPSAEDADLSSAVRSAATDEGRSVFGAAANLLSTVGIAGGDARLIGAKAGLQPEG